MLIGPLWFEARKEWKFNRKFLKRCLDSNCGPPMLWSNALDHSATTAPQHPSKHSLFYFDPRTVISRFLLDDITKKKKPLFVVIEPKCQKSTSCQSERYQVDNKNFEIAGHFIISVWCKIKFFFSFAKLFLVKNNSPREYEKSLRKFKQNSWPKKLRERWKDRIFNRSTGFFTKIHTCAFNLIIIISPTHLLFMK